MKKDVIIIGGGVVGLMSAYMLHHAGRSVTVIDQGDITDSTSFGNAGLISPFEKQPLSTPGIVVDTLRLMLQGKSPVILNPTLDLHLYRWLLRFIRSATPERVRRTMILFEKYGELSVDLYQTIMRDHHLDFDFHRDGLLMVYTEAKNFHQRIRGIQDDEHYAILTTEQTHQYLPFINDQISGGLLLKRNAHLDPAKMMRTLKKHLEDEGVSFVLNEEIMHLDFEGDRLAHIRSAHNHYSANTYVLATGAQTSLAQQAGKELMLTPAKGYSITFEMEEALRPKVSSIFSELFIACTPRRDDVRLTSKLELGSHNPKVLEKRINSIVKTLKKYTQDFEIKNPKPWAGFRPLPPNDMPLIGRDERYRNLVYATGLGWLGISFGPAIGHIISRLITRDLSNTESDDILLFSGFYQG